MVKSAKNSEKNTKVSKKAPVRATKRNAPAAKSAPATSKKYTNMFAAYRAFWRRGFTDWRGTSSRSEYWWSWLANMLILIALLGVYLCLPVLIKADITIISGVAAGLVLVSVPLVLVYSVALVVSMLSMTLRRLHDGGFSSWWILLYLVGFLTSYFGFGPYVGFVASLILFVFMLMPTRDENNPYHKYNK